MIYSIYCLLPNLHKVTLHQIFIQCYFYTQAINCTFFYPKFTGSAVKIREFEKYYIVIFGNEVKFCTCVACLIADRLR